MTRRRVVGPGGAVAAVAGAVTVAGMVATPLLPRGGRGRAALSSVVIGGLFTTTLSGAARRWGLPRALTASAATTVLTAAIENVGTRTGLPFGRYHYGPALRPRIGHVPVLVPLAWFAMAVPARETAHAALGDHPCQAQRLALGAAALTAWDLFLDPQMVGEGYWSWDRAGRYRGIPASNYVGWMLTALGVMALLEAFLPPRRTADPRLVGEYAYMGAMESLGFAAFFRDPLVAAVGAATMLPLAATALWRFRG